MRHGYDKLISEYSLDTDLEIYSTNSRSLQAHMNQIKQDTEYHCAEAESIEKINYSWIEDIFLDYPFTAKKMGSGYYSSKEILDQFMNEI